jgi:uncharacterized membrane protein
VPEWAIWLMIWWVGWFTILLTWYEQNKKEKLHVMTSIIMFLLAGLLPLIGIISLIVKAIKKDN